MSIHLLTEKISRVELKTIAQESFEVMVKAVVDVEKGVLALGGELHADANVALLARGSEKVLPDLVLCGREVGEEGLMRALLEELRRIQPRNTPCSLLSLPGPLQKVQAEFRAEHPRFGTRYS